MALDFFHNHVRSTLIKDGWTITNDPLTLQLGERKVYVDLAAERIIAAERGLEKIAVEIKSFIGSSVLRDLENAVGQYSLYKKVLSVLDPERILYLAIPEETFQGIFSEQIGQLMLDTFIQNALRYRTDKEEIIEWITQNN